MIQFIFNHCKSSLISLTQQHTNFQLASPSSLACWCDQCLTLFTHKITYIMLGLFIKFTLDLMPLDL